MTDNKIALHAPLEKGFNTTFLREMIGFAAERLMQLETDTLCSTAQTPWNVSTVKSSAAARSSASSPTRPPSPVFLAQ